MAYSNFKKLSTIYIDDSVRSIIEDVYKLIWQENTTHNDFEKRFSTDMKDRLNSRSILTASQYDTLIALYNRNYQRKCRQRISSFECPSVFINSHIDNAQLKKCLDTIEKQDGFAIWHRPQVSSHSNYVALGIHSFFDGHMLDDCNEIALYETMTLHNCLFKTASSYFTYFFCFSPDEKYFSYIDDVTLPGGPCGSRFIQLSNVHLRTRQEFKLVCDATILDRREWFFKYSNSGRYLAVLTWRNGVQVYDSTKGFLKVIDIDGHSYDGKEDMGRLQRVFEMDDCLAPQNKLVLDLVFSSDDSSFTTFSEYDEVKKWSIPK